MAADNIFVFFVFANYRIAFGITIAIPLVDFASESAVFNVTNGITNVIEYVIGNLARIFAQDGITFLIQAGYRITGGITIAGPIVINGTLVVTVWIVTSRIAIVIKSMRSYIFANKTTADIVTSCIATAAVGVRGDIANKGAIIKVTVGITERIEYVIGMKRPSSDEVHIIGYGSGLIPRGAVFKFPTGKGISVLGGVFQICKSFAACYFDGVQFASAGRIEGYGLGIKEHQNSCKCKRN